VAIQRVAFCAYSPAASICEVNVLIWLRMLCNRLGPTSTTGPAALAGGAAITIEIPNVSAAASGMAWRRGLAAVLFSISISWQMIPHSGGLFPAGWLSRTLAFPVEVGQPLFRREIGLGYLLAHRNLVQHAVHDLDVVGGGRNHRQDVVHAAQVELADAGGMPLLDQEAARAFVQRGHHLELGLGQLE